MCVFVVCVVYYCMSMSLPFYSTPWLQMLSSLATQRTATVKARWTAHYPILRGFSGTSHQRYIHPVKSICMCVCVSIEMQCAHSLTIPIFSTLNTINAVVQIISYIVMNMPECFHSVTCTWLVQAGTSPATMQCYCRCLDPLQNDQPKCLLMFRVVP